MPNEDYPIQHSRERNKFSPFWPGTEILRRLRWGRMAELYAAAIFLFYAALLFSHHSMPALADFSDWTYEGVLLRNLILGGVDHAHSLKCYPVPNSAVTLGVAFFSFFLPWKIAAKLWLCVIFAFSFFVSKHMMRTCRGSAAIWLIVPSAVFLNTNLWYGFVNFQLGLCWAILIASLLLRDEPREWIFGVLLVVAFFTHAIPFAFASLLVFLYALQSGRLTLLWQFVPSVALSLWYLVGRFMLEHDADGKSGVVSVVHAFSGMFLLYKVNTWLKSFGFINPAAMDGSVGVRVLGTAPFILIFLVNVSLCVAMAWVLIGTALSSCREGRKERFIWAAAIMFVLAYLIAPGATLGISDPGSRMLQTALAVVIFLSLPKGKQLRNVLRVSAAFSVLLAASSLFLFERTAFSPRQEGATVSFLPQAIVAFAHVDGHSQEYLYGAIDHSDMRCHIWPTAMFLNYPTEQRRCGYNPNIPSPKADQAVFGRGA